MDIISTFLCVCSILILFVRFHFIFPPNKMTLRSSQIDRLLSEVSSDEETSEVSEISEISNDILSYSGTDDFEPDSEEFSSEDDYESQPNKKRKQSKLHNTVKLVYTLALAM